VHIASCALTLPAIHRPFTKITIAQYCPIRFRQPSLYVFVCCLLANSIDNNRTSIEYFDIRSRRLCRPTCYSIILRYSSSSSKCFTYRIFHSSSSQHMLWIAFAYPTLSLPFIEPIYPRRTPTLSNPQSSLHSSSLYTHPQPRYGLRRNSTFQPRITLRTYPGFPLFQSFPIIFYQPVFININYPRHP
jgi:hypothetical protein